MGIKKQINKSTGLLFACMFIAIALFSCHAKRVGALQTSSKNKMEPVDSLVWYTGPIDTFENYEAYKEYLMRERNLIREIPLSGTPPELCIKLPDGSILKDPDVARASYHTKINIDSVPLFLRNLFPRAEFYYGRVKTNEFNYLPENPNSGDIICRINGKNYFIPQDVNVIFDETSKKNVPIEKKLELIISLKNGLHTNYKILSIIPKRVKIELWFSSYEIHYLIDNKEYLGRIVLLNEKEIGFIYITDKNGKDIGTLIFTSKLDY